MLIYEKRRKREQQILHFLDKMKVMDVRLLKKANVSNLGRTSDRNVLRVMQSMEEKGLVKSQRKEVKLWYMDKLGQWEHRLMMNHFIVDKGLLNRAIIEPKISVKGETFRPDFMIQVGSGLNSSKDYVFYEVDRTQKRKVNEDKISRYKRLGLKFEFICYEERKHMFKHCVYHIV